MSARLTMARLAAGTVIAASLLGAGGARAADLYNNTNGYAVTNGPRAANVFTLRAPAQITQLITYHWNGGRGAPAGTIALRDRNGRTYGPFRAHATSGQNNAPNVNWIADINIRLPAGTYQVIDSNSATWSQNAQSGYRGFAIVRGTLLAAAPQPAPNFGNAPRPPAPSPAPAPQPAAGLPLPSPCHGNSASFLELAKPVCSGPPGTTITLYVSRNGLKVRPTAAQFKRGPIGQMLFGNTMLPYGPMLLQEPLALAAGNGLQPGSRYTTTIPPGACATGRNHIWYFDVYAVVGGRPEDIDVVGVRC
ncbi:MAG: hypothetical protein KGL11_02260 [Alphaproteobacteria bacterium]|nr:hypothetical protein [Alphaproteobacteria bacterium]